MRYLITGGAGFIGSHIADELAGAGHKVTVLDDLSTGSEANLARIQNRIRFIAGSITDPATCTEAVKGADFVLHQAALPSVQRSVDDPVATHEVCATGTLNMLMAARDAAVRRFVYAASSSAYGDTVVLPKHEELRARPRSPYAAAKLAGESYALAFPATYGLETIALRYFNIFGPRQDPDSPYGAAIPKFIAAALGGEPATVYGDGKQTRDFTFVTNAVRANLLACEAPSNAVGQVFNVGCGDRISVNTLWQQICTILGRDIPARHAPPRPGDVRDSLASLDLARKLLGYEPVVGLEEGLRRTIEAYAGTHSSGDAVRL